MFRFADRYPCAAPYRPCASLGTQDVFDTDAELRRQMTENASARAVEFQHRSYGRALLAVLEPENRMAA